MDTVLSSASKQVVEIIPLTETVASLMTADALGVPPNGVIRN